MNDERTNADILADLADMVGDEDPIYEAIESRLRPPEPAEAKPPENRPNWMDLDSRIGVGLDDEQRQAEKAHRKEIDDREDAILNAIQDGDEAKLQRISGKTRHTYNLQR